MFNKNLSKNKLICLNLIKKKNLFKPKFCLPDRFFFVPQKLNNPLICKTKKSFVLCTTFKKDSITLFTFYVRKPLKFKIILNSNTKRNP